jgi:mRNA interferase MazF
MRPIHVASVDKARPVLVLTREIARSRLSGIAVVPITSRIRGISTEVRVGPVNGLDHECVVNLDTIATIDPTRIGRLVVLLLPEQEDDLARAVRLAFDLEWFRD